MGRDEELKELYRDGDAGDKDAARAFSDVVRRDYGNAWLLEPGLFYAADDDGLLKAKAAGHRPTMTLEKGDVVRVELASGSPVKGPWVGLVVGIAPKKRRRDAPAWQRGRAKPIAQVQPLDFLNTQVPAGHGIGRVRVLKDDAIIVLRRRGRPAEAE